MAECVICSKEFRASRSDAKCCSSNCRHKLRRERIKLNENYKKSNWELEDWKRLEDLSLKYPDALPVIEDFRIFLGRDVALVVLKLCEGILDASEHRHVVS